MLILKWIVKIWQDILENNKKYVSVKLSHGARFDCVVYDFNTVED